MATDFVSLREAVKATLDMGDLLGSPERMRGCILDLADSSVPEVKLVAQQLDVELAEYLVAAAKQPSTASLVTARSRIVEELADSRYVNRELSEIAADGLVGGLADHLGMELPPLESARPTEPAPSAPEPAAAEDNKPRQVASMQNPEPAAVQDRQPVQVPPVTPSQPSQVPPASASQPAQPAQAGQPQPAKSRLVPVLAGVAVGLAAAIAVLVVLLGMPSQQSSAQSDAAASQDGLSSQVADSSAQPAVDVQSLGWDKVPLNAYGAWVMTGMDTETHNADGTIFSKVSTQFDIDEHGNRLSAKKVVTEGSNSGTTSTKYYRLDGANSSGWPTSVSVLSDENVVDSYIGFEYLYDNPQIFKMATTLNTNGRPTEREETTYGEYAIVGTYATTTNVDQEIDYKDLHRYAWDYPSKGLPTSGTFDSDGGNYKYTITYDDHETIQKVEERNQGTGEYSYTVPHYTYVEHPSMWAYILSCMYDVYPAIY